jgi:predicted Fe-Mo cluster-binding NifX family protein
MKIAFTTSGNDLNAPLDSRFGRTARFLVYDTRAESYTVIDNSRNLNAPQGAGIQAARIVADAKANAVVTGHCGPKAFRVLSQAGIAIYQTGAATIASALEQLKNGELKALSNADVEGHWQ